MSFPILLAIEKISSLPNAISTSIRHRSTSIASDKKNSRRQPFFLAYFSSPLKKVRFPSTAPSNQCRNLSKRHMCVQLRTLSPCAAAEGYLSIIVPILPTLSLPNTLPIFFPTGRGCMEIGLHLEKTRAAHLPVRRVIAVQNIYIPLKPYSSRIISIMLSHPPSCLS